MIQTDNEVVGYINGKAIVVDDIGDYYFVRIPEEFVEHGETFLEAELTPVDALPGEEKIKILKIVMDEVV